MIKRTNRYQLTLRQLGTAGESKELLEQLQLDIENHDELFAIIQSLQQKNPFDNQQQAAEFVIGLKLFSEVMLKNRNHLLFDTFRPDFKEFMDRLKKL